MTNQELVQQIREEIENENQKPVVRFTLEPGEPGLCGSKVGGTPYLPHDMLWPLSTQGLPMTLLAQVDCAELQGLEDFPPSGLLQFFIGLDNVFGADFDDITKPGDFLVLYHETTDPSVTEEEVQAKRPAVPDDLDTDNLTPLCGVFRICFHCPEMQAMSESDFHFNKLFCQKWNARRPDEPINNIWEISGDWEEDEEEEEEENDDTYHQMGGYPYFTQWDPRMDGKYPELDVLLFQLDSDYDDCDLVLWGDCGVANFFISREDLQKRDFSKVGYTWDCC